MMKALGGPAQVFAGRRYLHMLARFVAKRQLIVGAAVVAAAAAFVVVSGLPAQAQVYYSAPYYSSPCQMYSYGPYTYSTCSPSNTYYNYPYYYGAPYYYSPYYGGGGSAVDPGSPGEGGSGHP
jgi:hypothetical protein